MALVSVVIGSKNDEPKPLDSVGGVVYYKLETRIFGKTKLLREVN